MNVYYIINSSNFYSNSYLIYRNYTNKSGYTCFSVIIECRMINHKWLKATIKATGLTSSILVRQQQLNQKDVPFPI